MKKLILSLMIMFSSSMAFAGWGAIAYDTVTGRYGYSYGWSTRAQAESTALSYCAATYCQLRVVGYNNYIALAVSKTYRTVWGVGYSTNRYEALYWSMYYCNSGTTSCRVLVNVRTN
ncbi:DUF4189 domain-containing protein [Bdellovibrio reynosensis]|uniref:DUF4189 domain-containing protein n=1 Tax=Bdellovibrio reynosensis TaxID=2835041 RepID=A0ABY4C655_9BACT|nr:DUF4189 domain-containing protein [Bdellovibrio reynosensis]UOE99968.1 DUF4189 domain-containing protein [Bdellovibrio reynosensis]